MKSYVSAINDGDLEDYRFLISSYALPQYGAGIRHVKDGKNYRKEVMLLVASGVDGITPTSKVKVITKTAEIPAQLYSVVANLLGLLEKYELGLISNPKDLEELSKIGTIHVFKKL